VSAVYARIFMWSLDLRTDLRPNDEMSLVYRVLPDLWEADIRAAVYQSQKHHQRFEAYWFKPADWEYGTYFNENGEEIALSLKDAPIKGYEQITSLLKDRNRHNGIDFKAPVGLAVTSPFPGKVIRINWRAPNGNCIELKYEKQGLLGRFLHLDRIKSDVKPGAEIAAGQVIAESGNTGHSTAPHLHYELAKPGGGVVDPLDIHETFHRKVPAASVPEFEQIRDYWRKLFADAT